jgi:hypothetical protein
MACPALTGLARFDRVRLESFDRLPDARIDLARDGARRWGFAFKAILEFGGRRSCGMQDEPSRISPCCDVFCPPQGSPFGLRGFQFRTLAISD